MAAPARTVAGPLGGRRRDLATPRWIAAPLGEGATVPVAVWSPPAPASPAPLLVFSHGYLQEPLAIAHLASCLACRGWLVGAPRHLDGRRFGSALPGVGAEERRCRELGAALTALLDPALAGCPAAADRVALCGHSYGGLTCLSLGGAVPGREDRRVGAILLLSPALFSFAPEDYHRVEAPTMILYGEREREIRGWSPLTKWELAAIAHANLPPPSYLLEVRGAGHYGFTSRASALPMAWVRRASPAQLALTARLATAFLDRHLLGRAGGELPAAGDQPRLAMWRSRAPAQASGEPAGEGAGLTASAP